MPHPENTDDQTPMPRAVPPATALPENGQGDEVLRAYFARLLQQNGLDVPADLKRHFAAFAAAPERASAYQIISSLQQQVMRDWKETAAIQDILQKTVQIPNARVGKPYHFHFDPAALGLEDITTFELGGLEETGLAFDAASGLLTGTPGKSGEFRLQFRFRIGRSDADRPLEEKPIALIVNADPKSLWRNLPSDETDPFWKPDSDSARLPVGSKTAVAASKRGRSHAHEARFRDDDFVLASLPGDWALLAVADGAGSAKYSRRGAQTACHFLRDFFAEKTKGAAWAALDTAITANAEAGSEESKKALSTATISLLQQAAKGAHDAIAAEAADTGATIKDFGTTLLFAIVRQFPFGWFIASFWVGDGAIGIYSAETGEVQLLGSPDGGEYAGQTRFLTMPDIFSSPDFYRRFAIRVVPDFTALFLLTDGITDPKFATDAALLKGEKWTGLWNDLQGGNEDKSTVNFAADNANVEAELLAWLDFWSPGNHDDRTIAILH